MKAVTLALAAVVVAASVGCSSGAPSAPAGGEFEWVLAELIEQAKEGEATAEQIAILEKAQETGAIPFKTYNEAVDRALRCIRETGGRVDDGGVIEQNGVPIRMYGVEGAAEAAHPAEVRPGVSVHRCLAEHSSWVEIVYQIQPSTVESEEALWEQYREPIVACLREQGVELAGDEPIFEIRDTAILAYVDGEVDCAEEFGLDY